MIKILSRFTIGDTGCCKQKSTALLCKCSLLLLDKSSLLPSFFSCCFTFVRHGKPKKKNRCYLSSAFLTAQLVIEPTLQFISTVVWKQVKSNNNIRNFRMKQFQETFVKLERLLVKCQQYSTNNVNSTYPKVHIFSSTSRWIQILGTKLIEY